MKEDAQTWGSVKSSWSRPVGTLWVVLLSCLVVNVGEYPLHAAMVSANALPGLDQLGDFRPIDENAKLRLAVDVEGIAIPNDAGQIELAVLAGFDRRDVLGSQRGEALGPADLRVIGVHGLVWNRCRRVGHNQVALMIDEWMVQNFEYGCESVMISRSLAAVLNYEASGWRLACFHALEKGGSYGQISPELPYGGGLGTLNQCFSGAPQRGCRDSKNDCEDRDNHRRNRYQKMLAVFDEKDEATGRTVGGTLLYAAVFFGLAGCAIAFACRLVGWARGAQ